MESIAGVVFWHEPMLVIHGNHIRDSFVDFKKWKSPDEFNFLIHQGVIPSFKFVHHGITGENLIIVAFFMPPRTSPVSHGHHFGFQPSRMVERRDRGLDVDGRLHKDF